MSTPVIFHRHHHHFYGHMGKIPAQLGNGPLGGVFRTADAEDDLEMRIVLPEMARQAAIKSLLDALNRLQDGNGRREIGSLFHLRLASELQSGAEHRQVVQTRADGEDQGKVEQKDGGDEGEGNQGNCAANGFKVKSRRHPNKRTGPPPSVCG